MDMSSHILVLFGGGVSLVSSVSGIVLSHWLESRRLARQIKNHPVEVVYIKQTEFVDKAVTVLDQLNGYITAIDVWLAETGATAKKKLAEVAASNEPVTQLHELLKRYYIYLPEKLVQQANDLFIECLYLSSDPSHSRVSKCYDLLFAFQNELRAAIGTETLSQDLLVVFGSPRRSKGGNSPPQ